MTLPAKVRNGACRCSTRDPGADVLTQFGQCQCHWGQAVEVLMRVGYANSAYRTMQAGPATFLAEMWAFLIKCRRDMVAAVRRQWSGTNEELGRVFGVGRAQLAKIEKGEQ